VNARSSLTRRREGAKVDGFAALHLCVRPPALYLSYHASLFGLSSLSPHLSSRLGPIIPLWRLVWIIPTMPPISCADRVIWASCRAGGKGREQRQGARSREQGANCLGSLLPAPCFSSPRHGRPWIWFSGACFLSRQRIESLLFSRQGRPSRGEKAGSMERGAGRICLGSMLPAPCLPTLRYLSTGFNERRRMT